MLLFAAMVHSLLVQASCKITVPYLQTGKVILSGVVSLWAHLTQKVMRVTVITLHLSSLLSPILLACQSSVPTHLSIEAKLGRNVFWMVLCNVYIFSSYQKSTKETRCQKWMFSVFVGRTLFYFSTNFHGIIFFVFHFKFSVFFMGTDFPRYKGVKNGLTSKRFLVKFSACIFHTDLT